jgi:hypothetical protein
MSWRIGQAVELARGDLPPWFIWFTRIEGEHLLVIVDVETHV